ncbi:signal peptidase II [Saccharomonospora viridis]|uniref:Lipoprotein signal peptidase n=2 Tax=Saccharomonospora viridis TaxID=1852 RepID=C7MV80_SACVD|nr:signal peptidase II [Saccharomonospora viridis]ACU97709.1 lipoprotein signal peptidase [Saccharomonospora viridis DSM 43017]KHF42259.1 peptidase A8 [Saccharomonospora viridis]SFP45484.1 signal peptidase II [Saccharomonospora viridis]
MNTEQQPDPSDTEQSADPTPARRRVGLLVLVAAVAYVVDVVTKVVATATLEGEEPIRLLGGAVYLQLLRNPYAAFGMDIGGTWILTVVAIAVVVGIAWFARKLRSAGWAVGLGLVLAGALGNLTDRIFRAPAVFQGHVVDFISVFAPNGEFFPVFNAADSAITVGAGLIVVLTLLGRDYDGTKIPRRRDGKSDTESHKEKERPEDSA